MRANSTPARALAIALGVIASGGALYILLKDDVMAGRWSDAFVLVPIMIVIALAAGHLAVEAFRSRKLLAALGFTIAFVMGSALTVYTSVGKQAESSDSQILSAEDSTKRRASIETEIADVQRSINWARPDMLKACMGAPEPLPPNAWPECRRRRASVQAFEQRLPELKKDLESLGSRKPVAADADRVAKVIHMLFGLDEKHVKAVLIVIKPFAFSLLFELTAIAAFGFAFGHRAPARAGRTAETQPSPETPPGSRKDPNIVSWVQEFERRHGRPPQIPEVQRAFNVGRTTAYRYARKRHGAA